MRTTLALNGLSRPYHFKFFKSCLLQISLCPFWNTLSQIKLLIRPELVIYLGLDIYKNLEKHFYPYPNNFNYAPIIVGNCNHYMTK